MAAALSNIDACPMEGFSTDEYDRILNLKQHNLTAFAVVALGYRAQDDAFQHYKKVRYATQDFVVKK